MGNFRRHNHETGMVHSHKSQRPRRKFITSDDDDDDYTDKDYSVEDEPNQLVLYDPHIKHHKQRKTKHHKQREVHFTEPIDHSTPLQQRFPKARHGHTKILPSIGYYTVQCANCFKWRIFPTKEKYEELRETISEELFVCARASEWNRVLSCDEAEDMSQNTDMVWAIDKPEIPQPPPGWDREVRIRGEGCSKLADVYYTSPSGTTLRSMVEIGRYLAENPYYIQQGVNLSQFSMLTPNLCKKTTSGSAIIQQLVNYESLILNSQLKCVRWHAHHLLLAKSCFGWALRLQTLSTSTSLRCMMHHLCAPGRELHGKCPRRQVSTPGVP